MNAISFVALAIPAIAIGASARRLWAVSHAMSLDPALLVARLKRDREAGAELPLPALAAALRAANAEPEASLVAAVLAPEDERPHRTNEVLFEIDDRFERWSRVPRVAASVSSTCGFLLASLALRHGLSLLPDDDGASADLREALLYRALFAAVDAAALGLFGALTCVALHGRARAVRRARMSAVDQLVQELDARTGLPTPDRVV